MYYESSDLVAQGLFIEKGTNIEKRSQIFREGIRRKAGSNISSTRFFDGCFLARSIPC